MYRSNFVLSIYEARQLINHKKVLLNNNLISKINTQIIPQDILSFSPVKRIRHTIKKIPFLFKYCSRHLHINYKTLELGLHAKPQLKNLSFPFRFKIRRFLQIYKV